MRITVNHAVVAEGVPPGAEHCLCDLVAVLERGASVIEEAATIEPGHGEQTPRREFGQDLGHANACVLLEDEAVEAHVLRLQCIVELFPQPRGNLLQHLGGLDGGPHAAMDRKQDAELDQVRLNSRLHVGILQLGGEDSSAMALGPMHLTERGGSRGLVLEACELLLPILAEFRRHAPPHEGPAHWRGVALELPELCGILGGKCFGDGGEKLRHLHDRPSFQTSQRGCKRSGIPIPLGVESKQATPGDAGRDAADIGADPAVAQGTSGEPVLFLVGWAVVHVRA
jgi:hypothetical protein